MLKNRDVYFLVMRLFNICEFSTIALFTWDIIKSKFVKQIIWVLIPAFIFYAVFDYFGSDRSHFNNHSHIVSALLIIILIIYFFYEKMKTVVMYPLYQSIVFWICVAYFLYFTGTFFFFLFIKSSNDNEFKVLMNTIYGVVTITKNILLCLSLLASESIDQQISDELHIPTEVDLGEFSLTTLKNS